MISLLMFLAIGPTQAAPPEKVFALLHGLFSIHEIRARVEAPTVEDNRHFFVDWPLDPAASRMLEDMIELEITRRLIKPSNDADRSGELPYVSAPVTVAQDGIGRKFTRTHGRYRRYVQAKLRLEHVKTGEIVSTVDLGFELRAKAKAFRLRLTRIGGLKVEKTARANKGLRRVFAHDARICRELAARPALGPEAAGRVDRDPASHR